MEGRRWSLQDPFPNVIYRFLFFFTPLRLVLFFWSKFALVVVLPPAPMINRNMGLF